MRIASIFALSNEDNGSVGGKEKGSTLGLGAADVIQVFDL